MTNRVSSSSFPRRIHPGAAAGPAAACDGRCGACSCAGRRPLPVAARAHEDLTNTPALPRPRRRIPLRRRPVPRRRPDGGVDRPWPAGLRPAAPPTFPVPSNAHQSQGHH